MSEDIKARQPPRKKKVKKQQRSQYASPDGISRPPKVEHDINEAFAIVFRGAASDKVLDYLKSITVNHVMAPGTDPNIIQYHEGARWLMGIISTRKRHGEEKKP